MKQVSPQEAHELLGQGWTYVDVRSEREFEQGHPDGAVNIPIFHSGPAGMTPNAEFVKVAEGALGKNQKLVIGCMVEGRSAKALQILAANGFTDLLHLRGGFAGSPMEPGWAAQGLPTENGQPAGRAYQDLVKKVKGGT